MSATGAPLEAITPGNDGPVVVLIAYVLLVFTALATLCRVLVTCTKKGRLELGEAFLLLALVFAIAQTVVTERAVDSGLGRHMAKLSVHQIDSYYKYIYASEILAIFPMTFAKMSVICLVVQIPGDKHMHRPCQILGAVTLCWTIFSFFSLLFECGANLPWVYTPHKCAGGLWYPIVIANILTDAVLSFILTPVLWKIQTSRSRRIKVICLFATRILVCLAAIVQLAFVNSAIHGEDQTRSRINFTILVQFVMNLSIITAVVPSLHRAIADLHSGHIGTRIPESHMELTVADQKGTSKSTSKSHSGTNRGKGPFSKFSMTSGNRSQVVREKREGRGNIDDLKNDSTTVNESELQFRPDGTGRGISRVEHDPHNIETGSRTSDGSEKMIIRQTVGWDVRYEDE